MFIHEKTKLRAYGKPVYEVRWEDDRELYGYAIKARAKQLKNGREVNVGWYFKLISRREIEGLD